MEKKTTKIDAYMPFYGADFFGAVEGYSDTMVLGYLRALWHYWKHHHCDGLPDDDEYLRRICRCERSEWLRTKGILFNKDDGMFFRLEGGLWHQTRCRELHAEKTAAYKIKVEAAARARITNPNHIKAIIGINSDSNSDSNLESAIGSNIDSNGVSSFVPKLQSESDCTYSESEAKSKSDTDVGRNVRAAVASPSSPPTTDDEWRASLNADKAYEGINVDLEYAKMLRWCEVNRKQATRRRFINWLNRSDRPLAATAITQADHDKGF